MLVSSPRSFDTQNGGTAIRRCWDILRVRIDLLLDEVTGVHPKVLVFMVVVVVEEVFGDHVFLEAFLGDLTFKVAYWADGVKPGWMDCANGSPAFNEGKLCDREVSRRGTAIRVHGWLQDCVSHGDGSKTAG